MTWVLPTCNFSNPPNNSVNKVLSEGFKTADLIGDDGKNLSTEEMGNQIIKVIKGLG
mgnify:CR=1 FL=1